MRFRGGEEREKVEQTRVFSNGVEFARFLSHPLHVCSLRNLEERTQIFIRTRGPAASLRLRILNVIL